MVHWARWLGGWWRGGEASSFNRPQITAALERPDRPRLSARCLFAFEKFLVGDLPRLSFHWFRRNRFQLAIAVHPFNVGSPSIASGLDLRDSREKFLGCGDTRARIGDVFDNRPRITISKNSRDSRAVRFGVIRLVLSVATEQHSRPVQQKVPALDRM